MKKIVLFLDIDDCLIKTSRLTKDHLEVISTQLLALSKVEGSVLGPKYAKEITQEFALSFRRLYDQHQGKQLTAKDQQLLTSYMKRLTDLERPVVEKYGEVKRWSREACLFIAAEKFGVKLTNEQIQVVINALWDKITQYATFYDDAKPFLLHLLSDKISFYLITSSDSRLILDDKKQLFLYDPEYSRQLKMRRLKIFLDLGIPEDHIFIGDPYDKPKTWVFEKALKQAKKELGKKFQSIMVGDSPTNDLIPAQKAGMNILVWMDRKAKNNIKYKNEDFVVVNKINCLFHML